MTPPHRQAGFVALQALGTGRLVGVLTRWHRRLALPAGVAVLLWGLSGVMHPIMSALSPQPQRPAPAATLPAGFVPVQPALTGPVRELKLMMFAGRPAWQWLTGDGRLRHWADARTGREIVDADRVEAERLARAFAGDASGPVARITPVSTFGGDYPAMNKILPVWRVEFARDDGLTAFVDTGEARLSTLTDDRKRVLMGAFVLLHSWAWASEPVKLTGIAVLLGCGLLTMAGGLVLWLVRQRAATLKPGQPRLRRWHRGLGTAVGVAGMLLVGSGLIHLYFSRAQAPAQPAPLLTAIPALAVVPDGAQRLSAVRFGEHSGWLVAAAQPGASGGGEHQHHHAADADALPRYWNGQAETDLAQQHALALAERAGAPAGQAATVSLVTQFGGEYGFFQKRLPVYRVDYAVPGKPAYYVEPATGAFSARIDDRDRLEGYVFAYLHKWHWLDGLGKTPRDVILAGFAAANVAAAALGLTLWWRRHRAR
ncbi:PepSY domain-containing protein [Jeongeupia naejangsanensis]|uniref:PepSY domain-containing protein n=1 Tax=Jeongeupia naejangsanensis TaxID=613195 RepID=A0ABS2BNU4_9NEIS|nr:PepSY domain-containing protein [Jeongeupia naejangsanensis]MBM3117223.1 PepSY domain-containing protein [Jeongeupia naejangsanensis]